MEKPKRPRRLRWLTVLFLALVAFAGVVLWQRHENATLAARQAESAKPKGPAPVQVTVGKAEKSDFPVYLEGLGTVQAFNTVTIRSRIDGQIVKLAVKEGQMVKAGDLIAQIDPRSYQAALEQAQAKKLQDQANLRNANLDLERYTTLSKQSFATQQQLDTQRSQVNQITAQIAADQAAIDSAQTQLSYATITAPISGRTGLRFVDEGNIVHATDTNGIISIQQIQPISVVFTAPESEVSRINQAQAQAPLKVLAYSADHSKLLSQGELSVVNNQVDVATGTIQLKATFNNEDNALWPGLSVATRLLVQTLHDATTIPTDAVNHGQNGLYVFLVGDDGKAHIQSIKVSYTNDGRSAVTEGITPGQTVVAAGQYKVQDGTPVKAVEPNKANPDQSAAGS